MLTLQNDISYNFDTCTDAEIISIIYANPEWVVLVISVYGCGNGHQY